MRTQLRPLYIAYKQVHTPPYRHDSLVSISLKMLLNMMITPQAVHSSGTWPTTVSRSIPIQSGEDLHPPRPREQISTNMARNLCTTLAGNLDLSR